VDGDWHSRTTSANGAGYTFCRMPIYEYRCKKGHTFDVMQRFSDDALDTCEVCGAPAQRVLHAPAVHFKGSGFYNTDYGTKKRAREMKEKESSTKSESSSSSSSSSGESKSSSGESSSNGSSSSSSDSSSKSPAKAAD
jgi:putative FmdB family regulatory protein